MNFYTRLNNFLINISVSHDFKTSQFGQNHGKSTKLMLHMISRFKIYKE